MADVSYPHPAEAQIVAAIKERVNLTEGGEDACHFMFRTTLGIFFTKDPVGNGKHDIWTHMDPAFVAFRTFVLERVVGAIIRRLATAGYTKGSPSGASARVVVKAITAVVDDEEIVEECRALLEEVAKAQEALMTLDTAACGEHAK